ncbi:hypothetical protein B6U74_06485 [Candidatus Bathyarchaeota archaeon ex4484_205]|nr:MAG: hypothetical protein B6U74_06485 [Candidatus Bathyarchaeota archaeon ex4484_205]
MEEEAMNRNLAWSIIIYLLSYIFALLATPVYVSQGVTVFEEPENPENALVLMIMVVAVFVIIFLLTWRGQYKVIKAIFTVSMYITMNFFFLIVFPTGWIYDAMAFILPGILILLVYKVYEWYTVNLVGIILTSSIGALLGVSLAPEILVLIMIGLMVYDFIVVKWGGMVRVAEATLEMDIPAMFAAPKGGKASLREVKTKITTEEREELGFTLIGLGDIAFPIALSASLYARGGLERVFGFIPRHILLSLITSFSALLGLILVIIVVERSRKAQPGLPYINGLALIGYLLTLII